MMGLPASVTKGDQRRFHFCRQCICRYHHSVATDLQRETEEILWLGMYEPIPFITIIWDNQWPWNLSIWHSHLSYLILIFHSLGHVSTLHTSSLFVVTFDVSYFPIVYIVLWFIMINKTLTVYIYIYIVHLFHCVVPYSIIVYRHFSHPSNIPISSAGRRQFAGESPSFKFGCASVETEPGAVEPQVLQKRPMESQKMVSLSFYGDCCSIFSEGVKCAMAIWLTLVTFIMSMSLRVKTCGLKSFWRRCRSCFMNRPKLTHSADADRHITSEHVPSGNLT